MSESPDCHRRAEVDRLTTAAYTALGYLDGLYDRGAIDAQGLNARQELRMTIRWLAAREGVRAAIVQHGADSATEDLS